MMKKAHMKRHRTCQQSESPKYFNIFAPKGEKLKDCGKQRQEMFLNQNTLPLRLKETFSFGKTIFLINMNKDFLGKLCEWFIYFCVRFWLKTKYFYLLLLFQFWEANKQTDIKTVNEAHQTHSNTSPNNLYMMQDGLQRKNVSVQELTVLNSRIISAFHFC